MDRGCNCATLSTDWKAIREHGTPRIRSPASSPTNRRRNIVPHRTTSRRSRRCWARSSSTTRRFTASRIFSSPSISSSRSTRRSTSIAREPDPRRQDRHAGDAEDVPARRASTSAGMTVGQYLARLAAEATTIINARGLRPHDLRPGDPPRADPHRRGHGQRRLRRAGRFRAARRRSRTPSAGCTSSPRSAATTAASSASRQALTTAVDMAARAYQRDGKLSGIATGLERSRQQDGRPAALRLDHRRRPPRHGQDRARHQHRLQRRHAPGAARCRPTATSRPSTAASSASSRCEMSAEQLATRIIAEQTGIPSSTIRRGGISERDFEKIKDVLDRVAASAALRRRDRRPVGRAARRARAAAEAPEGPRPAGHRLYPAAAGLERGARRKTACRKSPRSPPASRRWRRN